MNDVHLPRFIARCQLWSGHFCHCQSRSDLFCQSSNLYGTATRSQMHCGDSKDFSPSNSWNDSKNDGGASMVATRRTGTRCRTRSAKTNSAPRLPTVRNRACGNHPQTPMPATLLGNESCAHQQWQMNRAIGNQRCNRFQDYGKESNTCGVHCRCLAGD